jgi:hypothetical protein
MNTEDKEMGVVSIRRKFILGDYYSQDNESVSDDVKFFAGAVLTLLAPILIYCAVIGQLWPLYLMAIDETLGVILGVVMFKRSSNNFLSCVPATYIPDIPSGTRVLTLKKAA